MFTDNNTDLGSMFIQTNNITIFIDFSSSKPKMHQKWETFLIHICKNKDTGHKKFHLNF